MADSLSARGFYYDAVTEYYRFSFFHPGDDNLGNVYSKSAFCRAELGEWEESLDDIDSAFSLVSNDSLKDHFQIDRAVILAARGGLPTADSILVTVDKKTEYPSIKSRIADLRLLISVLRYDWRGAKEHIEGSSFDDSRTAAISGLLRETSEIEYKSPETAIMLSTLLPGAGQFYSGNFLSGLDAIALNGALAYATGHLLITERYGYAALTFYFGLRRYYEGNRHNAYEMALEYNRILDKVMKDRLVEIMSNGAAANESASR